jgi:hypothetical protein
MLLEAGVTTGVITGLLTVVTTYRSVPEFPADRLRVGDDGRVQVWRGGNWKRWRTCRSSPELSPYTLSDPRGNPWVRFQIDGRGYFRTVAHLVCRAFHGPRPLGCCPLHYPNPDPADNRADNLRWAPRGSRALGRAAPNSVAGRFQRGSQSVVAVFTEAEVHEARRLSGCGWSVRRIADHLGHSPEGTRSVITGRTWSHVPGAMEIPKKRGEAHHGRVLTDDVVRKGRELVSSGWKVRHAAHKLGVGEKVLWHAIYGLTWAHVEGALTPKTRTHPRAAGPWPRSGS